MKKLLLFVCLLPFASFTQNRNEQVRRLNSIVDYMNEASRLNQAYYFDAEHLAKAVYESREKVNPNYFYSSRTHHEGAIYYTDMEKAFRFKELVPDRNNQLPGYIADWIPYLEAREYVQLTFIEKKHPASLDAVIGALAGYIQATDSLFHHHLRLTDYIATKAYITDSGLVSAKQLLAVNSRWFTDCHTASVQLYSELEQYYRKEFPPNKTHAEVRLAEQEISLSMALLDKWQHELYEGDHSQNDANDAKIRELNTEGLRRDSIYLYKTHGYGIPGSGWWANTRYRTFYTSMHSTLYWYITASYSKTPYLPEAQQQYNKFVLSYNPAAEKYNDFIAIADGRTFTETSSCCLSPSEIDTNQNVMLQKPRLLYQFLYTDSGSIPLVAAAQDTTLSVHQAMINNAVPHHLVYLLDASASMNEAGKLDRLKENANYLVHLQRAQDRMSIVSFASRAHVILNAISCAEKAGITSQIDRIHATGSTNIDAGMQRAFSIADSAKMENGSTKILLITDGMFTMDKATVKLLRSFKTKNIGFCIIYIGDKQSEAAEKRFREICEQADGRFYNAAAGNLQEILVKEAAE